MPQSSRQHEMDFQMPDSPYCLTARASAQAISSIPLPVLRIVPEKQTEVCSPGTVAQLLLPMLTERSPVGVTA